MKRFWKFVYGFMMATSPVAVMAYTNGMAMRAMGLKSEFLDEIERRIS